MTDYQHILLELDGPVGTVWLNRPERNERPLHAGVRGVPRPRSIAWRGTRGAGRRHLRQRPGLSAQAVTSSSTSPRSGAGTRPRPCTRTRSATRMVLDLIELPKAGDRPGQRSGRRRWLRSGARLRHRDASEEGSFGEFWIRRGLTRRWVGPTSSRGWSGPTWRSRSSFTGELVTATRAAEIGMINALFRQPISTTRWRRWPRGLAAMPTLAVRQVKKLIEASFDVHPRRSPGDDHPHGPLPLQDRGLRRGCRRLPGAARPSFKGR